MQNIHFSHSGKEKISKSFGVLSDGTEVSCCILTNSNGMEISILNYGATIQSLKIPISESEKTDVVLGFETLREYVDSFALPGAPYLGSCVGRYAGRINNGKFVLNDKEIQLSQNQGRHHLHGGNPAFSQAVWEIKLLTSNSITLQHISNHNEENYPGKITAQVCYTLSDNNELKVEMLATTTEDTIINLTQHSYFNLDGHSENILNQELFVQASQILETTGENIPTGNFIPLPQHPFDFSIPKTCPGTIDTTFIMSEKPGPNALLLSPKNNLKMSVYTNQPAIHIYVGGSCPVGTKGKENSDYHSTSGICFEAQNFPDAPNHKHFPNSVLRKGEKYIHATTFKFENIV